MDFIVFFALNYILPVNFPGHGDKTICQIFVAWALKTQGNFYRILCEDQRWINAHSLPSNDTGMYGSMQSAVSATAQLPYTAVVPHLGIMLQEVKAESNTQSGPSDWTCFYSKVRLGSPKN